MPNKVTVSLLIRNGARYLPFCLRSLFDQTFTDWQLFICDNGSSDASLAVAAELTCGRSNITILASEPRNIGFALGHNKIIKQSNSTYVLLLNQDVIFAPDYLEKLVLFLAQNTGAGASSGLLLRWDFGKVTEPSEGKTNIIDTAGLRVQASFQNSERGAGEKEDGRYEKIYEVFGVSGALPLFRRRALAEAGFFDERFFSYKEDVDLAFRLRHAGWKSFCVGETRAWHARTLAGNGADALSVAKNRAKKLAWSNYLSYRNHWFMLVKDVALRDWLVYGIVIAWYELKKLAYLCFFEPKTLLAWREIIQKLPIFLRERRNTRPKSIQKWIEKF